MLVYLSEVVNAVDLIKAKCKDDGEDVYSRLLESFYSSCSEGGLAVTEDMTVVSTVGIVAEFI